jgi:glycosyltransferase involved in cell wall biosynthesis
MLLRSSSVRAWPEGAGTAGVVISATAVRASAAGAASPPRALLDDEHDVIDALPTLRRKRKGVRLLIAGDGPDEERLRSLVSERGLDGVVTFAGRISHAEVGQAYAACDLLVYPRAATETTRLTTPLKPLEAMALGRPVLVSRLAPLLELVQPGVTGAAFTAGNAADLASACLELLRHPDMRRQLGEAGRAWVVRERQWSATLRDYPRAYAAVMRSRAGEPAAALPATGAA